MARRFGTWAWIAPLAFAALLAAVAWTSYRGLEAQTKQALSEELETLLAADVTALRVWIGSQRDVARVHGSDPQVVALVGELATIARRADDPVQAISQSVQLEALRDELAPMLEHYEYRGFRVLDRNGAVIAAGGGCELGAPPQLAQRLVAAAIEGKTTVTQPTAAPGAGAGDHGVIYVAAPIRNPGGAAAAALVLSLPADRDFSRILSVARMGESGETYAFDADGVLVSQSRFDPQLRRIGLLPADDAEVPSFLTIEIRDPGGDMSAGYVPSLPLRARPLTRMAAAAVAGESGVDVDGYRDYRGVRVIGAWQWLPELGIGVATEIDVSEAFVGLRSLQRRYWLIIGLLVVAAVGIFFYSFVVVRLRTKFQKAQQLGRYKIERKLGAGGMGTVYQASHQMLRRPTALKLLRPDRNSEECLARFEREVQHTAALTHPNTIMIYDYGRTPEGVFYYAMEYLQGITVSALVEVDGAQPEARVVHVVKQACASLAEAHAHGLVHRDVKPANIMLCERGGLYDFVKVLDFGLVREQDQSADVAVTQVQALTGTPMYMSPEVLTAPETVGPRSDLYQLAAVAYYLLVGRPVFTGGSVYEILGKHMDTAPEPPSQVLGYPVCADLEALLLRCLAKDPADRPANAGEMLAALELCAVSGVWTQREAREWWALWHERHPEEAITTTGGTITRTELSQFTIDVRGRQSRS